MTITHGIPDTLQDLAVPVASLKPYGRNPRRGDLQAIVDSLSAHGQYKPILARTGTHEVLAGNHTLAAAKELGWDQIAATWITCDDDTAARIVLIDNRTSDLGDYHDEQLLQILDNLHQTDEGLEGTGYDEAFMNSLADLLNDDELEDPVTSASESATIAITGPQDLIERFRDALDAYDGENYAHRLLKLLNAHPRHSSD